MKKLKAIPKFKDREGEFEFWSVHDSTEYVPYQSLLKVLLAEKVEEELGVGR